MLSFIWNLYLLYNDITYFKSYGMSSQPCCWLPSKFVTVLWWTGNIYLHNSKNVLPSFSQKTKIICTKGQCDTHLGRIFFETFGPNKNRKSIFVVTVSTNINYAVDTVSTNNSYAVDTVSINKNYAVDRVSTNNLRCRYLLNI